jgi:hypothetical protein
MSDYKQTLGEYRVGVSFNPSNNPLVDEIKRKAADLIDLIEAIPNFEGKTFGDVQMGRGMEKPHKVAEAKRHAVDRIEEAAMWAVKAATKPERE